MTDLTQFFNFNRPPNGGYQQQGLGGHSGQQQASFDINEFPSLSKMSLLSQMQASSRANYVNIAKDNTTTNNQSSSMDNAQSEFTISSEDFPALPGSNNPNVSIIGTKAGGGSSVGNKSSSSSSSSTTTTTFNNQTIMGGSNNSLGINNGSQLLGSTSSSSNGANAHDIGTTAAIDQCGSREKSYFSPIVSASQKSMWMNGAVDRSSLLGSSPASTSFLDQKKLEEQQQARFKLEGLNDYTLSGHANDFSQATSDSALETSTLSQQQQQQNKDVLTATTLNGNTPAIIEKSISNGGGITTSTTTTSSSSQVSATTTATSNNNGGNNTNVGANAGGNGGGGIVPVTGAASKGVQISNDGRVTNIPSSMVADQFGMIGLLAFLRAAETDPNLASVTFGTDLTALGLNLTAPEKLYPSFAGPWADQPLKVYEIDYPVPSEYLVNSSIRDKLTQITLKRYHEDTIFFLFYMFPNDMLQIAAAIELYSREWRYHKEEKVWITRAPGIAPSEKTNSYERGTYYIFDAHLWRRVPREFVLQYDLLESKPTI